jgi:hypothetical protein
MDSLFILPIEFFSFFVFVIIMVAKDMRRAKKEYEKTSWIYHKHERKDMLYCNICGGIFKLDHSSVKKCLKLQKKAIRRNKRFSRDYTKLKTNLYFIFLPIITLVKMLFWWTDGVF